MDEHEELKELLSAYLDGEMDADERARFEARLAAFPELEREAAAWRRIDGLYRALPRVHAPDGFEADVRAELASPVIRFPRRHAAPQRLWPMLAAAAGVAVMLGLFVLRFDFTAPDTRIAKQEVAVPAAQQEASAAQDEAGKIHKDQPEPKQGPVYLIESVAPEPAADAPKETAMMAPPAPAPATDLEEDKRLEPRAARAREIQPDSAPPAAPAKKAESAAGPMFAPAPASVPAPPPPAPAPTAVAAAPMTMSAPAPEAEERATGLQGVVVGGELRVRGKFTNEGALVGSDRDAYTAHDEIEQNAASEVSQQPGAGDVSQEQPRAAQGGSKADLSQFEIGRGRKGKEGAASGAILGAAVGTKTDAEGSSVVEEREVAGRKFKRIDDTWREEGYSGEKVREIRRGARAYARLTERYAFAAEIAALPGRVIFRAGEEWILLQPGR